MPKLAFIFRTDVHVTDKSPASWKGDYPAEVFESLRQIGMMAEQHQVTAVLDGGDYFHIKAASRNSHAIVYQSASVQNAYPCATWCVEGNHDISYNNLTTIEKQPLGVLYETGVFRHLREEVFEDGDLRVRIVGVPYSLNRSLAELREIKKKPGDTYLIAIIHALAGFNPPNSVEDFFGEPVFRYKDLVYPDGPDLFCFGHWHKDQGIESIDDRTFVNVGAVSRGALIRENLERTPKVALIEATLEGIRATPLPLDVLPANEVFDVERKERQDEQAQTINQFVQKLWDDVLVDSEASIDDTIMGMEFAKDVRDMALSYLENARLKKVS